VLEAKKALMQAVCYLAARLVEEESVKWLSRLVTPVLSRLRSG